MFSQKPEAQCACVCKSAAEAGRVKNKIRKKKDDYFTPLARTFVHEQHGHGTGKMCKEEK